MENVSARSYVRVVLFIVVIEVDMLCEFMFENEFVICWKMMVFLNVLLKMY